jgi:hypothetical protein
MSARTQETFIRLTPQGQRLAKRLATESPREQVRTIREIEERVRRAKKEDFEDRKRIVLGVLRDSDKDECGHFVLLEKISQVLDLGVMETVLLLHEINGNRLDPPDYELHVHAFFNDRSGEVWVELWEPD